MYENNKNNKCNCNPPKPVKDIKYFHNLISEIQKTLEESENYLEKAIHDADNSLYAQEDRYEKLQKSLCIMEEASKWLEVNSCNYNCNINNPNCKHLLEEIKKVGKEMTDLEKAAYNLILDGLKKLEKSECLEEEVEKLSKQYISCVHRNINPPDCKPEPHPGCGCHHKPHHDCGCK